MPDCTVFLSGIFNAAGINRRVNRGVNRRSGLLIFSRDVKKSFCVFSLNRDSRFSVRPTASRHAETETSLSSCLGAPTSPLPLPPHCHGCCVCRADAPLRCLCYRCCGNRLQRRVKDSAPQPRSGASRPQKGHRGNARLTASIE